MKLFTQNEKGAVLITFAFSLIPMLGMAALMIDGINIFYNRFIFQSYSDSAALATTNTLIQDSSKTTEALERAQSLYQANTANITSPSTPQITLTDTYESQVVINYSGNTLLAHIILPSWTSVNYTIISKANKLPSGNIATLIE